jgi:hypothetical protein
MGELREPLPVKLFLGMISSDTGLFSRCADLFCAEYGPVDLESDATPWDQSDYYRAEMGTGLQRKFVFMKTLIDPSVLSRAKILANRIEATFAEPASAEMRRRINLDPGYVTEAKVVLASTKDFSHRIYIGERIYAEVTLHYSKKSAGFTALDHTYFDFRTEQYRSLFNTARDILRKELNR